jgi:hypothetical protein
VFRLSLGQNIMPEPGICTPGFVVHDLRIGGQATGTARGVMPTVRLPENTSPSPVMPLLP